MPFVFTPLQLGGKDPHGACYTPAPLSKNSTHDCSENSRMNRKLNRQVYRKPLVLIPLALLVLITACQSDKTVNKTATNSKATPTVASTPNEFAAARASFEKNCKVCH